MNSSFFSGLQANMNGYGGGAAGDVASIAYGGIKKLVKLPIWLLRQLLGGGDQGQGQQSQPSWQSQISSAPLDQRTPDQQYLDYIHQNTNYFGQRPTPAYMQGVENSPGFSSGSFNPYVGGLSGDSSPTITQPPGPPAK